MFIAAPALFNIGDVRTRHCKNLYSENAKPFSNDPEDPSAAALKVIFNKSQIIGRQQLNILMFY